MLAGFAADTLMLIHLAFIVFVVLGGLLVWRWGWLAWVHLPTVLWGAYVELAHKQCPLTPWEQSLRAMAGESGYSGGFIDHYLMPLIYPQGLTADISIALGLAVLLINSLVYALLIWRRAVRAKRQ